MEEKQMNEKKPEFKGNLGFIWLVGILVILLGCTVVYVCKLKREVNDLKQTPQETVQPVTTAQEQAKTETENTKTENVATTTEVEDKDAKKVYGLDTKFKEISKAAIKSIYTFEEKNDQVLEKNINYSYDLNNDGVKEKITGTARNLKFNGKTFYKADVEDRCPNIYIVDLDKNDNSVEIVLQTVSGTGAGDSIYYNIYKMQEGKIKELNYFDLVATKDFEDDIDIFKMYTNSNGKFILVDQLQNNLTPMFTSEYFEISGYKVTSKEIDLSEISKEKFVISKSKDANYDNSECLMVKSEKELKTEGRKDNGNTKKFNITKDTEIYIVSFEHGKMKVKLTNGDIRYIYSKTEVYYRFGF